MQVIETLTEGLKRACEVTIPGSQLSADLDRQLHDIRGRARIDGFRPGKAPLSYLRRLYGRSVLTDVLKKYMEDAQDKILQEKGLRLATQTQFDVPDAAQALDKALNSRADLKFTLAFEVLPTFELGFFGDIALTRYKVEITDALVEEALQKFAEEHREFVLRPEEEGAETGDKILYDNVIKIDGEIDRSDDLLPPEHVLGTFSEIPVIDEGLVGIKAGEQREILVPLPEDQRPPAWVGKEIRLFVTAKAIEKPTPIVIDDTFAQRFNYESLEAMRTKTKASLEVALPRMSRDRLKRLLLDELDKRYTFAVPETLVEQELQVMRSMIQNAQQDQGMDSSKSTAFLEKVSPEFRKLAERRVRLGLIFAEQGSQAQIEVSNEEMTQALIDFVNQFPGEQQKIWDYYHSNPQALAMIRKPIYEDKVVDHILGLVQITESLVDLKDFERLEEEYRKSVDTLLPDFDETEDKSFSVLKEDSISV